MGAQNPQWSFKNGVKIACCWIWKWTLPKQGEFRQKPRLRVRFCSTEHRAQNSPLLSTVVSQCTSDNVVSARFLVKDKQHEFHRQTTHGPVLDCDDIVASGSDNRSEVAHTGHVSLIMEQHQGPWPTEPSGVRVLLCVEAQSQTLTQTCKEKQMCLQNYIFMSIIVWVLCRPVFSKRCEMIWKDIMSLLVKKQNKHFFCIVTWTIWFFLQAKAQGNHQTPFQSTFNIKEDTLFWRTVQKAFASHQCQLHSLEECHHWRCNIVQYLSRPE